MYLNKIPGIVHRIYGAYLWRYNTQSPDLYLTFDDGPHPEITPWVLDQLKEFNARATFFVVGKNVQQYPEIVHRAIDEGHSIGNHSYSHLNGWDTDSSVYLKDFLRAQRSLVEYTGYHTRLFRPPYGKVKRDAAKRIMRTHKMVMMDVISGDFDLNNTGKDCQRIVIQHAKPGSIILLHDSDKAWDRLEYALPRLLRDLTAKGFQFLPIGEARAKAQAARLASSQ
ncbi:MAG: polysaccharide deacetylase family protein [Bacteroidetes bacterium]|nr:MAG: polysaccharide deacetylase family protein [Bacteroidota bacterium]